MHLTNSHFNYLQIGYTDNIVCLMIATVPSFWIYENNRRKG